MHTPKKTLFLYVSLFAIVTVVGFAIIFFGSFQQPNFLPAGNDGRIGMYLLWSIFCLHLAMISILAFSMGKSVLSTTAPTDEIDEIEEARQILAQANTDADRQKLLELLQNFRRRQREKDFEQSYFLQEGQKG